MIEVENRKAKPKSLPSVQFVVEPAFLPYLQGFPWNSPIDEWKKLGIKHLDIKRGVGRHSVIFVEADGRQFVIKQLSAEGARREVATYRRLLETGIHTLMPIGYVIRTEGSISVKTLVGSQHELNVVGHSVTQLMDRVIPDSLLYRRAFKFENRRRIWNAIVNLFVVLHSAGRVLG